MHRKKSSYVPLDIVLVGAVMVDPTVEVDDAVTVLVAVVVFVT